MKFKALSLLAFLSIASTAAADPGLREDDRTRLAEAFHLADAVQESIWKDWSEVPFAVLLVTEDYEYLIRHPRPSEDFVSIGYDSLLKSDVLQRPTTGNYPLSFLATFPAVQGVNTVVIGKPENTGKSSTLWVITALHEHFHQLQYTRPDHYPSVDALDLSGGDKSGMWQLNYPFPYEDPDVGQRFYAYKAALEAALAAPEDADLLESYRAVRKELRENLDPADYRYFSFQLWQEGVARFTEYAVAEAASKDYEPTEAFTKLEDFMTYEAAQDKLRADLAKELENLDLSEWKRVVFYPIGALEALLLDAVRPGWRDSYFEKKFDLERMHDD